MSQRYPPPLRDRSPPRQFDRRSSNTYTPLAASSSYRPGIDNSQPPIDRPPPRGPRADSFRGGNFSFNSAPRGRGSGFGPRGGDLWDRDRDRDLDRDRDVRNAPGGFRRDDDRPNWTRRDDRPPVFNRDRPYVGRERSASPVRPRGDSKENIGPTFNRAPDSGPGYFSSNVRGGSDRGRGRGGWDRSRGRSSFIGDRERDLFPAGTRSRSREGWRDREVDRGRNFGLEVDRNERFERREYDRPFDRDGRARDHDIWQRDHSPGRSSTGNRAASPGALSSISQDRGHKPDHDLSRKPLASSSILQSRDTRRDADGDYFTPRNDVPRREPSFAQPPPVPVVPQSSSLGLDYGPPPSAPTTTPAPSAAEKPTLPSKTAKPEPPVTTSSFQPPSGPKADRGTVVNASHPPPFLSTQPVDRSKIELFPQHDRSQMPEPASRQTSETPRPANEAFDRHAPMAAQSDRPLPPNVPSGPRMSSATPYKPKTSPVIHQTPLPPTQPKAIGTEPRSAPPVPTGPRSASILPPSGPRALPTGPASAQGGPSSSPWVRRAQIEYRPQKPSIMNTMNRPHMADRPSSASMQIKPKQSPRPAMAQLSDTSKAPPTGRPASALDATSQMEVKQEAVAPVDVEMSARTSEDEEGDSEPESELDESYFADSEKIHAREMELLKAKKPPLLLEDPAVINLLVRIQLLGMIAEGLVPEGVHVMEEEKDTLMHGQPSDGLVSPSATPREVHTLPLIHPKPRGRPLKELPVNPIPTPPIEDLPFLQRPLENAVVFEEPDEDEVQSEKITTILRNQFEKEAWDEKEDLEELREFYRRKYPEWKYEIDKYERMRRELEATPDPGSPGGQSSASLPQSVERLTGRAARNATEFDIEKAILMSQQSAREEEERREREAASNAKPNPDTEAVVPAMLKPSEREPAWRFQDTNTFVPAALAANLMQYVPPEDDFTDEEQARFITAFCQTPKKWGLIAEQISGRSYQECIAHYYLTKNLANYKEHLRRSQPKRKRGRAATKPRSTALISDMALNEDPDSTPVPVTDSGRPRRAAAPTFGDVTDPEGAAIPAAKRLAVAPTETVEGATVPKPRGRKAGTATKVRRTKAQILADKQQAMALQMNPDGSPVKVGNGRARTLAAAKTDLSAPPIALRPGELEAQQLTNTSAPMAAAPMRPRSPQPLLVTSYWSVPEQQKFRQLVAYYGKDFGKIADFMKTKSQAMIKNHYQREYAKGDVELERLAQIAEDKVNRGEPLGKLPSPVAPVKRKYDSTPAMAPRPLTTNPEAALEAERAVLSVKAGHVEDFPANAIVRDTNGSIVAKPSPREALLQHSPPHVPVQAKMEDPPRDRPILAQKAMQGPPRGLFAHDEAPFHQHGQQRHQFTSNDQVLHHHPPHVVDLRAGDVQPTQPRDLLAQSRDAAMHRQSGLIAPFRGTEPELAAAGRPTHSRNASLTGLPSTIADQQALEALAIQNDRRRFITPMASMASTQSPRLQPMQASVAARPDPYSAFSLHHHQQHQQQQQQQQQKQQQPPPAPKPEPPKPAPAKRSNVFGLLNNDDPPERPVKRSSTDSTHRISIQTPPPQPSAPQPQHAFQQRAQNDLFGRPGVYGVRDQPGYRNTDDLRSVYSNSPAPSHRPEAWLDKFDPRQTATDRTSNQSPSYSVVPPAPVSGAKPPMQQSMSDGLRTLESNGPRRSDLGRPQISSPPRQISTPVSQFRSASAAPQHNRISSLTYGQSAPSGPDHRSIQQQQQQQQQHHPQPSVSHAPSASATPISSMHRRGESSMDYNQRRLTIQEYQKTQGGMDQPRDMREAMDRRNPREDILPRGHELQPRQIAPPAPPTSMQEQSRPDTRDMYRSDPGSHQVPPPPSRTSQYDPRFGAAPPRTFSPFSNDPRLAHNQHAHQHHHSLSAQQGMPQQQQQQQQPPQGQGGQSGMHQQHHHHALGQHQPQLGIPPQGGHQGLAPHGHQPQPMHQGQPPPQYREQPRFGQPQQGLAPLQHGHYRGYSQGGGEDRR